MADVTPVLSLPKGVIPDATQSRVRISWQEDVFNTIEGNLRRITIGISRFARNDSRWKVGSAHVFSNP